MHGVDDSLQQVAVWPCADLLELELQATVLLGRCVGSHDHEKLRLTDAGIHALAQAYERNQNARGPHESLVKRVADQLGTEGRLAWRRLKLRVPLPRALLEGSSELVVETSQIVLEPSLPEQEFSLGGWAEAGRDHTRCMAMPDVFSIRRSTVEAYLEPVVHEIKVCRADLLCNLRKSAKRADYPAMAGAVWYVLGDDAKGRRIAKPEEVPPECGVLQMERGLLVVARSAPCHAVERLSFHVWMALAQAGSHMRQTVAVAFAKSIALSSSPCEWVNRSESIFEGHRKAMSFLFRRGCADLRQEMGPGGMTRCGVTALARAGPNARIRT